MNILNRLIPAGVLVFALLQMAMALAIAAFFLWVGWDVGLLLWRFVYGFLGLLVA